MKAFRTACAALLITAAVSLPLPSSATSFTTDQSDAWAVDSESGWGWLTFQRGSVIFGALFVYDPNRVPIWYSVTMTYLGNSVWKGDLYQTRGPWFGTVPFNWASVTYRRVGTAKWTATSVTSGQLEYDVDGVSVVKSPSRVFVANDDFSGRFAGAIHQTTTGCLNASLNGTREDVATINITQNGQGVSVGVFPQSSTGSCTYSGPLVQAGQMGSISGTFACSNGETGTMQFYETQTNTISVTTRFNAKSNTLAGCQYTGYAAGMRITTF